MLFWSAARSDAGCFFCNGLSVQSPELNKLHSQISYLLLLSLLQESLLTLLLLALLFSSEVLGLGKFLER